MPSIRVYANVLTIDRIFCGKRFAIFLNQSLFTFHLILISFFLNFLKCVHLCLPVEIAVTRVTFDFFLFLFFIPMFLNIIHFHDRNSNNTEQNEEAAKLSQSLLSMTATASSGRSRGPLSTVGDGLVPFQLHH